MEPTLGVKVLKRKHLFVLQLVACPYLLFINY